MEQHPIWQREKRLGRPVGGQRVLKTKGGVTRRLLLLLFSRLVMSDSFDPMDCSTPCLPVPYHLPKVCPSSCLLHQWCHPAISSSDALFSICPQFFPASGTFPMGQLFASDDQNTEVSASASVLPMSIQGWFPLRLTGLISLLSKGLSGVFSSTTAPRHRFFSTPPSFKVQLSQLCDHWGEHSLDYTDLCWQSNVSSFQHTV